MHHLSQALAIARVEELHRAAAQRHTIRLARRVAHEQQAAATAKAPRPGSLIWTGRRDVRLPP